ncbi:YbaB/EbfC family nucleoid-associated protein [Ruficoccus sp. ZRK36]|uniref:YbaB/EbfC family nucleoid-associated protein n=1 Tax=Ruficoccus sp. ZRK36 TaxID=2866311 RepID=UPI001C72AB21|nr:YbaB/EbfC family nucleoid-associated protein [Ruficoccus sp. ZRK36]QYY35826.1 YbaB/EbfC family nucleoid-associated protein [Ruficoccus sp. ZRK36]
MAGVGKLLKQAKKMQQKVEQIQEELTATELEVSAGGGAVTVKVNGQGEFLDLKIDPEFIKEDAEIVQETLLEAIKDAAAKAKALNEEKMSEATAGFQMPGFM